MKKADLQKFCSKDETRFDINRPWSAGDYTYATNGHIIVRVPRLADVPENKDAPKIDITGTPHCLFPYALPSAWISLADVELPDAPKCTECDGTGTHPDCPECDGEGTVEFDTDYNNYEIDCKSCDGDPKPHPCKHCGGTGRFEKSVTPIIVANAGFQRAYLAMLKSLPNCRIGPDADPLKQAPFQFDGGDGLLMPMKVFGDIAQAETGRGKK